MDRPSSMLIRLNGRTVDFQLGSVADNHGSVVKLRPQAAEVLKLLSTKQGKLVGKDELIQAVWPGIAVTDDSLVQCITEIRKALGDDKHEIVKTIPKRGYVLQLSAKEGPLGLRRQYWAAITVTAVGLAALAGAYLWPLARSGADPPAIAVLPFENLSADAKWDRFADGITEDIITDLARFRDIPVIARTSTEVYRGKAHDVRDVGKALNVDYVLEGSLRIDLHRLRVAAQLIDARTGEHVWSERYDRTAGDFFAIQDEITEKIAATLTGWQSPISQAEKAAARRKSHADLDAYDYWLLGAAEKHKMTPASQIAARKLFEKGLTLDPDFQPMVRDLGFTYNNEAWMSATKDPDFAIRKIDELSARAVELDPQDPLAWTLRSISSGWRGETELQRRYREQALALGPNNADVLVLTAVTAVYTGLAKDGAELADRALRLNPNHPHWWNSVLVPAYFHAGEFRKAYPFARKLGFESPVFAAFQAMIAAELGKSAEAAEAADALKRLDPDWRAEAAFNLPLPSDRTLVTQSAEKAGVPVCLTAAQVATAKPAQPFEECEEDRAATAAAN